MRIVAVLGVCLAFLAVPRARAEEPACVLPGIAGGLLGMTVVGGVSASLVRGTSTPLTGTSLGVILGGMTLGAAAGPIFTCRGPFSEGRLVPAASFVGGGLLVGFLAVGGLATRVIRPSEGGAQLMALAAFGGGALGAWGGYALHRWRVGDDGPGAEIAPVIGGGPGTASFALVGRF